MSDCRDVAAVAGCYSDGVNPPVSVVIVQTHDHQGAPVVRISDVAGAIVPGANAGNTTVGSCAGIPPDIEWQVLCDVAVDGSSVEFVRRKVTTFDFAATPTTNIADFGMDYATPYVVAGTVAECALDCPALPVRGLVAAW